MENASDGGPNRTKPFAQLASLIGVELSWSTGRVSRLYTTVGTVPVMTLRRFHFLAFKTYPIDVRCHGFQGTLTFEWQGREPSRLDLFQTLLREVFLGIPFPYNSYQTLRTDHGLMAVWKQHQAGEFEIVLGDRQYQVRNEPSNRFFAPTKGFVVSDENGKVMSEVLNKRRQPRITIHRAVNDIEAVLVFSFLHSMDLRDVPE